MSINEESTIENVTKGCEQSGPNALFQQNLDNAMAIAVATDGWTDVEYDGTGGVMLANEYLDYVYVDSYNTEWIMINKYILMCCGNLRVVIRAFFDDSYQYVVLDFEISSFDCLYLFNNNRLLLDTDWEIRELLLDLHARLRARDMAELGREDDETPLTNEEVDRLRDTRRAVGAVQATPNDDSDDSSASSQPESESESDDSSDSSSEDEMDSRRRELRMELQNAVYELLVADLRELGTPEGPEILTNRVRDRIRSVLRREDAPYEATILAFFEYFVSDGCSHELRLSVLGDSIRAMRETETHYREEGGGGVFDIIGGIKDTNDSARNAFENISLSAAKLSATADNIQAELDALHMMAKRPDGADALWEKIVSRIEDALLFLTSLTSTNSIAGVIAAIMSYVKTFVSGSIVKFLSEHICKLVYDIYKFCNNTRGMKSEGTEPVFVDFIKILRENWGKLRDSAFLKMISDTFTVLCAVFFTGDENIVNKLNSSFKGIIHTKCWDFTRGSSGIIDMALKATEFFATKAAAVLNGAPLTILLYDDDQIAELDERYRKVIKWKPLVSDGGLHMINEISDGEFTSRELYWEEVNAIKDKFIKMDKAEKNAPMKATLKKQIYVLDSIDTDISLEQERKMFIEQPFTVLIFSGPGTGKTPFTIWTYKALCRATDFPTGISSDQRHLCNISSDEEYDEIYNPKVHHTFNFQDICNAKENKMKANPLDKLRKFVENSPEPVVRAVAERKGKDSYHWRNGLGSTNAKFLQVWAWTIAPGSALRRWQYIVTIDPKKDYVNDRGTFATEEFFPSAWNIVVEKVVIMRDPNDPHKDKFELVKVLETSDVQTYLEFIGNARISHGKRQKQAVENINRVNACELCEHFRLAGSCDKCCKLVSEGADEIEDSSDVSECTFETCGEMAQRLEKEHTEGYLPSLSDAIAVGKQIAIGAAVVGATIGGIYLARSMFSRYDMESEGAGVSIGREPEPVEGEKENEWAKKKVYSVPLPLKRTGKAASTTPDNLVGCLTRSVFFFRIDRGEGRYSCGVLLPLKGNLFLSTSHNIHPGIMKVANVQAEQTGICELKQAISEDDISRIVGLDACVVRVVGLTTRRGYLDYFLEESPPSADIMTVVGRMRPDWLAHDEQRDIVYAATQYDEKGAFHVSAKGGRRSTVRLVCGKVITGYPYVSDYGSFSGMCGAPAVMFPKGGTAIAGIHAAGDSDEKKSFVLAITKGDIEEAMEKFSSLIVPSDKGGIPVEQYGYNYEQPLLTSEGYCGDTIPPSHAIHFIPEEEPCAIDVFGMHDRGMRRLRSSVKQLPISKDVAQIMELPRIHGKPKHIGSYHPWQSNLVSTASPENLLDPKTLSNARLSLERKMTREIDAINGQQYLHVWTYDACVNGVPGVSGADRVNNSTSAGDPICKAKKVLSEGYAIVDDDGTILELKYDPEVERMVNDIRDRVLAGERIYTIFQAHVKDEATKFTKENLRIFAGCQLAFLLFCKMYLGGFNRMLQVHWDQFECCVSANCYNSDWTRLFNALSDGKCMEKVMAGDYKQWDKSQTPQLILSTGETIRNLCSLGDYTDDDLKCIEAIFVELAFPLYEWNGIYIQAYCTLPSGVFCTVITSNFNNSMLMRYSYMQEAPPEEYWNYDEHVNGNFMGDDNILFLTSECTWFDMLVHAKHMKAAGITYTSADKHSELTAYVSAHDASYLKRRWVWSDDVENYIAPLEEASMSKQLHNYMDNKSRIIPVEALCGSAIDSVSREYFRHGKEVYERRRKQLETIVERHELGKFSSLCNHGRLPSYEMMVAYYRNGEPECTPPTCEDDVLRTESSYFTPTETTMNFINKEESTVNTSQRGNTLKLEGAEGRLGISFKDNSTVTRNETVKFEDVAPNTGYEFGGQMDLTNTNQDCDDDDLQNYFHRPIKILDGTWNVGATFTSTIDVWNLFMSNKRNINRFSNYYLMRGNLHVKILVNGNSFYFGRLMASYLPFYSSDEMHTAPIPTVAELTLRSQRPHVFVDPTLSQGGELVLPFFCDTNNLDVPLGEWAKMGHIILETVIPLAHANNSTESISYTIFVHASDVKLSIPTSSTPASLSPQGVDEIDHHTGVVSGPASAIATAARGIAAAVPSIAPYAMASSMVAETVAGISRVLGWSRAKVTATAATRYKPELVGNMANVDVPENVYSLALDSKNEVTIDPKVTGLKPIDEMTVSHIVAHESIIAIVPWQIADTSDELLYTVRVDPYIMNVAGSGLHLSATAYASRPFLYWTGTINFRFQVVCSSFHKGRLKISYDPAWFENESEWNINNIKVIDISECRDFTISIPMCQTRQFVKRLNDTHSLNMQSTTTTLGYLSDFANGVLEVAVVNALTTPQNVTDEVSLIVSISGGSDLEFAVPSNDIFQLALNNSEVVSQLRSEGAEEVATVNDGSEPVSEGDVMFNVKQSNDGKINQIYFGEVFSSFRALVKRYNAFARFPVDSEVSPTRRMMKYTVSAFPPNRGYQVDAMGATSLSAPFNYSHTTMLNYLSFAYVGWRGSLRWKLIYSGEKYPTVAIKRTNVAAFSRSFNIVNNINSTGTTGMVSSSQYNFVKNQVMTNEGCYLTPTAQNPVMEVEMPYYTNRRFQLCRLADRTSSTYGDNDRSQGFEFAAEMLSTPEGEDAYFDAFVAGGDDLTFNMYIGPPILYNNEVLPAPLGSS